MSKYRGFPSSPLKSRMTRPVTENDALPHGWEMLIDPETQWPFFVDHTNCRTSWKDPRPSSRMQEFMESAMGGDNFFRSPFDQRSPFWQSQLDPFGPRGLNRSPRGSPSMQRRTPPHGQDIRRSPSPQPVHGRVTPPLESRMSRMHTHEQPHETSTRHSQQTYEDQHGHVPQNHPQTAGGERVIHVPIRVEGGDFINAPSHVRYRGPPQEPTNMTRVLPQSMPKPEFRQPSENHEIPVQRHEPEEDKFGVNCNQRQSAEPKDSRNHVQEPDLATSGQEKHENWESVKGKTRVAGNQQDSEKKIKAEGTNERSSSHQETKSTHEYETESKPDSKPSEEPPQVLHIREILSKILGLRQEIEDFMGRRGNKDYLLIEETLVRLLLELDNVDTMGNEHIRAKRRMAVVTAQTLLSRLEKKAIPQNC